MRFFQLLTGLVLIVLLPLSGCHQQANDSRGSEVVAHSGIAYVINNLSYGWYVPLDADVVSVKHETDQVHLIATFSQSQLFTFSDRPYYYSAEISVAQLLAHWQRLLGGATGARMYVDTFGEDVQGVSEHLDNLLVVDVKKMDQHTVDFTVVPDKNPPLKLAGNLHDVRMILVFKGLV